MALRSVLAVLVAGALLFGAAVRHVRRRSPGSAAVLLATLCMLVVALTHVFEAYRVLPGPGWGRPNSVGHYIDLTAAVLGLTFIALAVVLESVLPRFRSRSSRPPPG